MTGPSHLRDQTVKAFIIIAVVKSWVSFPVNFQQLVEHEMTFRGQVLSAFAIYRERNLV